MTKRFSLQQIVFWGGLALLVGPTLIGLAQQSWRSEAGAHGPIVLTTAIWLLYRDRSALDVARPGSALFAGFGLLLVLPLYWYGRVTSSLGLECIALYVILLVVAYFKIGLEALRRIWFPIVYLLFLIAPPANYTFELTRPIKLMITMSAVYILGLAGLPISNSGITIQIGQYALLVATACSGLNSLISLTALSLFYIYMRHGSNPRYAFALLALVVPIAILLNFLRVVILILITYFFGAKSGSGFAHVFTGVGLFVVALFALYFCDRVLKPVVSNQRRT